MTSCLACLQRNVGMASRSSRHSSAPRLSTIRPAGALAFSETVFAAPSSFVPLIDASIDCPRPFTVSMGLLHAVLNCSTGDWAAHKSAHTHHPREGDITKNTARKKAKGGRQRAAGGGGAAATHARARRAWDGGWQWSRRAHEGRGLTVVCGTAGMVVCGGV